MSPYLDVSEVFGLRRRLQKFGWCVIRGVFSAEEIDRAREVVSYANLDPQLNGMTYGQSFADISCLFHLNVHVNNILQEALGSRQLLYFGDAVLRTDNGVKFKFHKDNILRESPSVEFDEPVSVVRCGWYLADHTNLSGGIAFQTGSHLRAGSAGFGTAAASRPSDLIIWYTTTSHAANFQRFGLGDVVLPSSPPLHKCLPLVPRGWLQNRVESRITYLPTFASPGSYFDSYSEYISDRKDYMSFIEKAKEHNTLFEEVLDPKIWSIQYPSSRYPGNFAGHWEDSTNIAPIYAKKLKKVSAKGF